MFLKEPEGTGRGLRHLEAELMTLVAEVLGFAVHVVAVHAVELVLVVRRDVRIRGLDALGLFNEILGVVALGAGLDVGSGRIGLVGAVAGFARQTHGGVAVGAELAVGGSGRAGCEERTHEHDGERTEVFHGFSFFDSCFGDAPSGPGARVSTLYDTRELKARVRKGVLGKLPMEPARTKDRRRRRPSAHAG